jgi:hypothetical protein
MNRVFSFDRSSDIASSNSAVPHAGRSSQRLRNDAEKILRDVAFVLAMTRRVKSEILESREFAETAMA